MSSSKKDRSEAPRQPPAASFADFHGNSHITAALSQMLTQDRLAQTLLFSGPEGVGKATLARRLAAQFLPHPERIELDDLSLPDNMDTIATREKWTAEKRNDDPLLFASHPDFVTFAPDGPLRQISISQTRLLKERAQFLPHQGQRRVFLINHVDRANDQAANSLLKTLEEPPAHLILIMTAENAYDLLPTIRSRAVPFQFAPLPRDEMLAFVRARNLDDPERRVALAAGSPGIAISLDLETYDKRRAAMLALIKVASGAAPFSAWVPLSESIGRTKSDKLEFYLKVLYDLLRDLLLLRESGAEIRNQDIRPDLESLAGRLSFSWIRKAVAQVDEIAQLIRRNIQKSIALDSLIATLRS
jgi:DNA polymerase-3 subunit delta'